MKFKSDLPANHYIAAMKEQMGSFSDFGMERFTGMIIGRFFSVTYHSGHEFNRRITNEKHRAIGFVSASGNSTEVSCIRLAGMTNPVSLMIMYGFCMLISILMAGLHLALLPQMLILYAGLTFAMALITAFADSVTERGREGSRMMTAFLHDPVNFYSNLY